MGIRLWNDTHCLWTHYYNMVAQLNRWYCNEAATINSHLKNLREMGNSSHTSLHENVPLELDKCRGGKAIWCQATLRTTRTLHLQRGTFKNGYRVAWEQDSYLQAKSHMVLGGGTLWWQANGLDYSSPSTQSSEYTLESAPIVFLLSSSLLP